MHDDRRGHTPSVLHAASARIRSGARGTCGTKKAWLPEDHDVPGSGVLPCATAPGPCQREARTGLLVGLRTQNDHDRYVGRPVRHIGEEMRAFVIPSRGANS
ncbi:hypothetical protein GCM10012287_34970 [Streptomyces daqingensis]|uniref:Uncharacterized protein n=1 Tax=Streptomyces daqingensis TaxID=1472640 RepID=A0ABQ2MI81_9ACTN|nr:hypothetical protein GCM10012287_34970 [Streptomyces daqingensis]